MLPAGYTVRPLEASDHAAYLDTLRVLTTVGDISEADFGELWRYWTRHRDIFHPHVIANADNVVVATGMLLVEKKAIHGCGLVGHIEDIAVAALEQGKKLGLSMIAALAERARGAGCYKVILDCASRNVGFYEKCGFEHLGCEMVKRFH